MSKQAKKFYQGGKKVPNPVRVEHVLCIENQTSISSQY